MIVNWIDVKKRLPSESGWYVVTELQSVPMGGETERMEIRQIVLGDTCTKCGQRLPIGFRSKYEVTYWLDGLMEQHSDE